MLIPGSTATIRTHGSAYGSAPRRKAITLRDWLDVAWFYPSNFEKTEIRETAESYLVFGTSTVLKFFKDNTLGRRNRLPSNVHASVSTPEIETVGRRNPLDSAQFVGPRGADISAQFAFALKWRKACEEVRDGALLAPRTYLGIYCLAWHDDEPTWVSYQEASNLDPNRPPKHVDDLAILLRRVPEHAKLSHLLARKNLMVPKRLELVADVVGHFHRRARIYLENKTTTTNAKREVEHSLRELERELQSFHLSYSDLLDPYSRLAFFELTGFFRKYLDQAVDTVIDRIDDGFVVEAHGNLKADAIFLEMLWNGLDRCSILGRGSRVGRCSDVLQDIASFALDLRIAGHEREAKLIEQRYFANHPQAYDRQLYRFFIVASLLRRVIAFSRFLSEENISAFSKNLSSAVRYTMNLQGPLVVAMQSNDRQRILQGLQNYVAINVVQVAVPSVGPMSFSFDNLLRRAKATANEMTLTVLDWPFEYEEERYQFEKYFSNAGIRHVMLDCRLFEDELPAPEFCLELLRSLSVVRVPEAGGDIDTQSLAPVL